MSVLLSLLAEILESLGWSYSMNTARQECLKVKQSALVPGPQALLQSVRQRQHLKGLGQTVPKAHVKLLEARIPLRATLGICYQTHSVYRELCLGLLPPHSKYVTADKAMLL